MMLGAEVILIGILRLPFDLSFISFAFADRGSWLTVCDLVAHGARPGVDFGYCYGLFPIFLSSGWFKVLGATPFAYQAFMAGCGLVMAWAIARMAHALKFPFAANVLLLIALPFAIQSTFPSAAHALEAVLLCSALAEHSAGRRGTALALVTASCFTKPSMGYLYGLALLILIQVDLYRRRRELGRNLWRTTLKGLAPATITGSLLLLILAASYGTQSLVQTLMPFTGIRMYAALRFGFFHGAGREFWSGMPPAFWFGSVIAFWFAASVWLTAAGIVSLIRLTRRGQDDLARRRDEFIVTVAILHAAFVTAFFAGPSSWTYYSYILVMGAAAACTGLRVSHVMALVLTALAATGQTSQRVADMSMWRTESRSPSTAGLWASSKTRQQWTTIVTALHGRRAAMISAQGCAPLLAPQILERNDFAYLIPGIATSEQLHDALQRFADAPMVVVVIAPGYGAALDFWPQIKTMLARRRLVLQNGFYALYANPAAGTR